MKVGPRGPGCSEQIRFCWAGGISLLLAPDTIHMPLSFPEVFIHSFIHSWQGLRLCSCPSPLWRMGLPAPGGSRWLGLGLPRRSLGQV